MAELLKTNHLTYLFFFLKKIAIIGIGTLFLLLIVALVKLTPSKAISLANYTDTNDELRTLVIKSLEDSSLSPIERIQILLATHKQDNLREENFIQQEVEHLKNSN